MAGKRSVKDLSHLLCHRRIGSTYLIPSRDFLALLKIYVWLKLYNECLTYNREISQNPLTPPSRKILYCLSYRIWYILLLYKF